jgi:hypothetical protein
LLCREHYHCANTRLGTLNPQHAFLGGNCPPNSGRSRNVGSDPPRCPRIIQIHPHLISGRDIRQTPVCPAFQNIEELSRKFDCSGFWRAVERIRQSLEVHLLHVQIIAQDGLHSFVVKTQYPQ